MFVPHAVRRVQWRAGRATTRYPLPGSGAFPPIEIHQLLDAEASEPVPVSQGDAAERIRVAIEEHRFVLDDVSIGVTIGVGVATAPDHGTSVEQLVGAADEALYRAKETGRNRVCVSPPDS